MVHKRIIVSLMTFFLVWGQSVPGGLPAAYADEITDAAGEGKLLADDLSSQNFLSDFNASTGTLNTPDGSLKLKDLFPGTSDSGASGSTKYFPDQFDPDESSMLQMHNDEGAMAKRGQSYLEHVRAEVGQENEPLQSTAYSVLLDDLNKSRPNLSNDPMFKSSLDTLANVDQIAEEFGDCDVDTHFDDTIIKGHVPDYKSCDRVVDRSGSCTISHQYDLGIIRHAGGPANIAQCGSKTTTTDIVGRVATPSDDTIGYLKDDAGRIELYSVGDGQLLGYVETDTETTQTGDCSVPPPEPNPDPCITTTTETTYFKDATHGMIIGEVVDISDGEKRVVDTGNGAHIYTIILFETDISGEAIAGCVDIWAGPTQSCIGCHTSSTCVTKETFSLDVEVLVPSAIISATITETEWDGYVQIKLNDTIVYESPNSPYPPDTGVSNCAKRKAYHDKSVDLDVTNFFTALEPGTKVTMEINVSGTGRKKAHANLRINYDETQTVSNEQWEPDYCLAAAKGVLDGFADGSVTCTEDPSGGTNSLYIDGQHIKVNAFESSPLGNAVTPFCKRIEVVADYNFYKGRMDCWTDTQGVEHCPEIEELDELDTCKTYEENPSCGFVSTECLVGGSDDNCYLFKERWDCGTTYEIPSLEQTKTYNCPGEVRCMGDECVQLDRTQSTDFGQAAAMLQAAQAAAADSQCYTGTGDDRVCDVFTGTAGECKRAVGGTVDCCEDPGTTSIGDYITMMRATMKTDELVANMTESNPLYSMTSGYRNLRGPAIDAFKNGANTAVNAAWDIAKKPIQNFTDSNLGSIDLFAEGGTGLITQLQDKALTEIINATAQTLGTETANQFFGDTVVDSAANGGTTVEAATTGADTMFSAAHGAFTTIMAVYMYYQVAVLLIQIVYACEEEEFEVTSKVAIKACHYVGTYCASDSPLGCIEERESYCCFNSPLSRIVQEQVRPQLGLDFGDAENPQCGGVPVEQLGAVDWTQVDLSEWMGILASTGNLYDAGNINLDSMTGTGSLLDMTTSTDRPDAVERTNARFGDNAGSDQMNTDELRQKLQESASVYTGVQ